MLLALRNRRWAWIQLVDGYDVVRSGRMRPTRRGILSHWFGTRGWEWDAGCLLFWRCASLTPSLLNNVFDVLKQLAWFPPGVHIKPVGPSEIQSFSRFLCLPSPLPVPCVTRLHQTNAVALVRDGTAEQTRRFTTILLSNFSNSLYLRELWLVLETTRTLPLWLFPQAIKWLFSQAIYQ